MCDRLCFNKIFWAYMATILVFMIPPAMIGFEVMDTWIYGFFAVIASVAANLALIYGVFSRTRNMGYSPVFVLLTLLPLVNFVYLIMLLAYRGRVKDGQQ